MKKTIALISVSLFFLSSCINDTTGKKANLPTEKSVIENRKACLEIVNKKYDFGKISKKEHSYLKVTNFIPKTFIIIIPEINYFKLVLKNAS